MHVLVSDRMTEPYLFGMQIQAIGLGTVEFIALDRSAESFRMSAVDAQLMSAPRLWIERNDILVLKLIIRHCPFTMFMA